LLGDQAFPARAAFLLSNVQRTSARVDRCELAVDHVLGSDPDGFVADTPMGRYTGVKEMIEMSKTPGGYKYPLTPLCSWQPRWL